MGKDAEGVLPLTEIGAAGWEKYDTVISKFHELSRCDEILSSIGYTSLEGSNSQENLLNTTPRYLRPR